MKKETLLKRTRIANNVMSYIYLHIDTEISLDELSEQAGVSRFHMHRIFRETFGRNIYESIKSIRLQKAANLLIANRYSTISEITERCGYASHSAFIKVFRERFSMTPKQWRGGGFRDYADTILQTSPTASRSSADFSGLEPSIVRMPSLTGYYIRHDGYDKGIKNTWRKLYTWILDSGIEGYKQIGLHHDNPAITPLDQCRYIACVVPDKMPAKKAPLPEFTIPGGVYARFHLSGVYGDVLKFLQWTYLDWIPSGGYETTTSPPYAIYEKNHFLSDDEQFVLTYYVPVRY